jgi:hypothetical protein
MYLVVFTKQVGFNAGDGRVSYVVNASRSRDIINVNRMFNIGISGEFAFRIDAAKIDNGGCNAKGIHIRTLLSCILIAIY